MSRKRQIRRLNIYWQGNLVGTYVKTAMGDTVFTYDKSWVHTGFPISQNLPTVTTPYKGDRARTYFENLLPDLKEVRESIAAKVLAHSSDHFDLLVALGGDCVGALVFRSAEDSANLQEQSPEGTLLSHSEIGDLIRNLKPRAGALEGANDDFRISLAGVQEKTALLRWKGKWQRPKGPTPTTHILKPPMNFAVGGFDTKSSVHNEYFCMKLCQEFGLKVANVDIEDFGGEKVLVVERFDRFTKQNIIYRRAQEDMCQALGYFASKKYQSDEGPGVKDLASVLATSVSRREDLETFFKSLVVFFVIGAIDGHAKNYSIQYVRRGHQLAPLYDILSVFPGLSKEKIVAGKYKMALAVGKSGHYRASKIQRRHFLETAKYCQTPLKRAEEIIDEVLNFIDQEVWNRIIYSKKFDQTIKEKIVRGVKIVASKLMA